MIFVGGAHYRLEKEQLSETVSFDKVENLYEDLLKGNFIGMESTVLYRKEVMNYFHFNHKRTGAEDYSFNLEIARHFPGQIHSRPVAVYRIHGNNTSAKKSFMLEQVNRVLQEQKQVSMTIAEKASLEEGIINWKKLYS